jgi:hypothetical protein
LTKELAKLAFIGKVGLTLTGAKRDQPLYHRLTGYISPQRLAIYINLWKVDQYQKGGQENGSKTY